MFSSFSTDIKVSKFIDKEQMSKNADATSESLDLKAEFGAELSALMNQTVESKETIDPSLKEKVDLIRDNQDKYTNVFTFSEENGTITIKKGQSEVVMKTDPNGNITINMRSDVWVLQEVYTLVFNDAEKAKRQKSTDEITQNMTARLIYLYSVTYGYNL